MKYFLFLRFKFPKIILPKGGGKKKQFSLSCLFERDAFVKQLAVALTLPTSLEEPH